MNGWRLRESAYAALFAAATAVSAQVTIPFPLVPMTLQVLMTLLAGAVLGRRLGALSQLVYVLMGSIGLPVFAARQGGVGVIIGPTGGYLIGMIIAAWVVGAMVEIGERAGSSSPLLGELLTGAAMLCGLLSIYIPGVLVLSRYVGSIHQAVAVGVITFLPADLIKVAAAYGIAKGLKARGVTVRAPATR